MELHGKELIDRLNNDYGGLNGLIQKLKTDRKNGLQSDNEADLEQRRNAYGQNEIPLKPISFSRLCWEAVNNLSFFTVFNDWRKEKQFLSLQNEN
ncbi:unnamed protein product [Didymodactylos carnosus]|uniref:Cation-transporting P-type ATPase N-terminal domain-containing protein n=1 Tax=Didymodactylos carnosus TaxID=1234261 RepID=A0A8S2DNL4_9BILA|nr:unnamed protein product [Didymodactylos carnosus]CAF3712363.1 unnamed protein product [Didymodactylos carnosus]